jgi:citrate lyase subunit beta / citryl-CoA lyase
VRSLLFVPGDAPGKIAKGLGCGADALILDLEDSVAPGAKAAARAAVREALAAPRDGGPRLLVRVNGLDTGHADADLDGIMPGRPDAIVLPKTVGGASVAHLAAKIAVREAECDLADGATNILAIATESAAGLFEARTLAGASHRLKGIAWGAEDLSADLGAETNRDETGAYAEPYRLARTITLLAAASAGVDAVDTVYTAFRDLDGLAAECRAARRDGFVGKMAIHPAQVAVINEAFTPTPEAVARARAIVAAFAENPALGVVGIEGEMIDRPHLIRAERLLARLR